MPFNNKSDLLTYRGRFHDLAARITVKLRGFFEMGHVPARLTGLIFCISAGGFVCCPTSRGFS